MKITHAAKQLNSNFETVVSSADAFSNVKAGRKTTRFKIPGAERGKTHYNISGIDYSKNCCIIKLFKWIHVRVWKNHYVQLASCKWLNKNSFSKRLQVEKAIIDTASKTNSHAVHELLRTHAAYATFSVELSDVTKKIDAHCHVDGIGLLSVVNEEASKHSKQQVIDKLGAVATKTMKLALGKAFMLHSNADNSLSTKGARFKLDNHEFVAKLEKVKGKINTPDEISEELHVHLITPSLLNAHKIGKGTTATVHKALNVTSVKIEACKKVINNHEYMDNLKDLNHEVKMLKYLSDSDSFQLPPTSTIDDGYFGPLYKGSLSDWIDDRKQEWQK